MINALIEILRNVLQPQAVHQLSMYCLAVHLRADDIPKGAIGYVKKISTSENRRLAGTSFHLFLLMARHAMTTMMRAEEDLNASSIHVSIDIHIFSIYRRTIQIFSCD